MAAGLSCPRQRPERGDTPSGGVTASHVRMVLGRDRVRGRESIGGSFSPTVQDRSRAIPSTYARKHSSGPGSPGPLLARFGALDSEVHVAAAGGSGRLLLLRLLRDHCLGGEEQAGDGRRVLQGRPGDL